MKNRPLLCLITDQQRIALRTNVSDTVAFCRLAATAGVDLIQIREKALSARELFELACGVVSAVRGTETRVLVNDRVDVALAAKAHGAHLTTQSLPLAEARHITGKGFLLGVSTHSLEEAIEADRGGADYVLLGPVFDTPSKRAYGKPLGPEVLSAAVANCKCSVIALGGINLQNYQDVLRTGVAGIAAIRLFTDSFDLVDTIAHLKLPI
ncbi:MAG: thiamine phosphate synthase [Acidobacteriota bacterium]|nr:thiamine phosphate synthase [Blastocatellia bacterium]MDW8413699.1 thiamine phosphate synthase [Acidobacteriota bacterium]